MEERYIKITLNDLIDGTNIVTTLGKMTTEEAGKIVYGLATVLGIPASSIRKFYNIGKKATGLFLSEDDLINMEE